MLHPLQFGVPGGMELAVIFLLVFVLAIPIAVGYWVSQDAKKRGSGHHVVWGAMTFLSGLAYLVPMVVFLVFYLIVRDDIGTPSTE